MLIYKLFVYLVCYLFNLVLGRSHCRTGYGGDRLLLILYRSAMQTPTPSVLKGKVTRPAIIELGVADAALLAKTKTLYEALLGETNYPYRLTTDMALLCVATENGSTHTIIYWEVPGGGAELTKVYDDLIKNHGCGGVHKPHKPPKEMMLKGDLELATLADASGNVLGLVTNPPYPPLD